MQENNFEGKVNEIMEGFSMDPSQAVWQKLQPQIAKKKRRRRAIIFLFALLLCLFVGGIFINNKNTNKTSAGAVSKNIPAEENKQSEQEPATVTAPLENKTGVSKNIAVVPVEKNEQQNKNAETNNQKDYSQKENLPVAGKTKANTSAAVITEIQDTETTATDTPPVSVTEEKLNDSVAEENKAGTGKVAVITEEEIKKPVRVPVENKEEKPADGKKEIAAAKKQESKKANKNQWNLAFNLAAGFTATAESYLSSRPNNEAKSFDGDYSTGNGGPTSSQNLFSSSPVKPGLSFTAGIAAIKQLSAKTSFSAGLAYRYASASVSTGKRIPASTANSRDSIGQGNSNTYRNRYHFIELPLEIRSMIGKGEKLPLYWNAGINTSLLLHTNVLQFQNRTGRYYADNSVLNKLQLGVSAGLMVNVLNKKYPPLLIGPSMYYSLTSIAGKGLYSGTHYSFAGIRLQKQLTKK